MDYRLLGKRIREERLRLGKTQERLAEEVNISTAYLGQIERGKRSVTLDKLMPLANKLGVSVDFLLAEYLTPNDDNSLDLMRQLFSGKTAEEKELANHDPSGSKSNPLSLYPQNTTFPYSVIVSFRLPFGATVRSIENGEVSLIAFDSVGSQVFDFTVFKEVSESLSYRQIPRVLKKYFSHKYATI